MTPFRPAGQWQLGAPLILPPLCFLLVTHRLRRPAGDETSRHRWPCLGDPWTRGTKFAGHGWGGARHLFLSSPVVVPQGRCSRTARVLQSRAAGSPRDILATRFSATIAPNPLSTTSCCGFRPAAAADRGAADQITVDNTPGGCAKVAATSRSAALSWSLSFAAPSEIRTAFGALGPTANASLATAATPRG